MISVELKEVSKKFRRRTERPIATSLKSYLLHDLWRPRDESRDVIWALQDVNLKVKRGCTLGVIGPNGAGKSTLIKLVGRILEPDAGEVKVRGRVAALIELGAGFHPELTGRENVLINGMILGLTKKQVRSRLDEIVEFAELKNYIDDPVRTYSSGMFMRLGFAVATSVVPDILIVDEVLAVGDEKFQRKCLSRMRDLRRRGRTILVVSHDLEAVRQMCDEACLLERGMIRASGRPARTIAVYQGVLSAAGSDSARAETARPAGVHPGSRRWGTKAAEIAGVTFLDGRGRETLHVRSGEPLTVRIRYVARGTVRRPVFGLAVNREDGVLVTGMNTKTDRCPVARISGGGTIQYRMDDLKLLPGSYLLSAAIYNHACTTAIDHWEQSFPFTVVESEKARGRRGFVILPGRWTKG